MIRVSYRFLVRYLDPRQRSSSFHGIQISEHDDQKSLRAQLKATYNDADDIEFGHKKEGNSLGDQDQKAAAAQHFGRSIC